ncbi:hypothetical protein DSECCO2_463470 [anaerobic digester metagenome]
MRVDVRLQILHCRKKFLPVLVTQHAGEGRVGLQKSPRVAGTENPDGRVVEDGPILLLALHQGPFRAFGIGDILDDPEHSPRRVLSPVEELPILEHIGVRAILAPQTVLDDIPLSLRQSLREKNRRPVRVLRMEQRRPDAETARHLLRVVPQNIQHAPAPGQHVIFHVVFIECQPGGRRGQIEFLSPALDALFRLLERRDVNCCGQVVWLPRHGNPRCRKQQMPHSSVRPDHLHLYVAETPIPLEYGSEALYFITSRSEVRRRKTEHRFSRDAPPGQKCSVDINIRAVEPIECDRIWRVIEDGLKFLLTFT